MEETTFIHNTCNPGFYKKIINLLDWYIVDATTSSEILKAKQKLGGTFNSDKLGSIAFQKFQNWPSAVPRRKPRPLYRAAPASTGTAHAQFWNFCKINAA